MEIKVGEYIKTIAGYIGKIINFSDGMYTAKMKDAIIDLYIDDIKNHKENIIDLIEEGDYVNGYLVKDIDYAFDDVVVNNKNARIVPYIDCNKNNYIDDIKSIVTKEQFNQMKYIVGDEINDKN